MVDHDRVIFRGVSDGVTHEGCVRMVNEDNFFIDDRLRVWAVADGMGGHYRGDLASATVMEALRHVRNTWPNPKSLALDILSRLEDAHREMVSAGERMGGGVVGSTVACLTLFGDRALLVWCGDSRIYLLRRGEKLRRVTRDHTVVQDMLDAGRLLPHEVDSHQMSHVLTRGLGIEGRFEPDFEQVTVRSGDRFLICSDGLTAILDDEQIAAIAARARGTALSTSALLEAALKAGAPDNVAVVTVDLHEVTQAR